MAIAANATCSIETLLGLRLIRCDMSRPGELWIELSLEDYQAFLAARKRKTAALDGLGLQRLYVVYQGSTKLYRLPGLGR